MKKFLLFFSMFFLLNACSDEADTTEAQSEETPTKQIQMFKLPNLNILNQKFVFSTTSSDSDFANQNEIVNAINNAVKCTLTPKNATCTSLSLPKFILMEDESLQRPTQMQYQIVKIKPLAGGLLHVYTQSQCNNNWFGLCQGTIVYVLENANNQWHVSDIFALTVAPKQK